MKEVVSTSLKADCVQDISDSVCFYQAFSAADPYKLVIHISFYNSSPTHLHIDIFLLSLLNDQEIPPFINYFINGQKTPSLILKTGTQSLEVGIQGTHIKKNWSTFVLKHNLNHNDILVFIPESETVFCVIIFDPYGVEKIFPWYHTYSVYSRI